MTDQELRALVRDAVARHLRLEAATTHAIPSSRTHPSHAVLALVSGGDADGACLIEPTVPCIHCGYCQSYGH